MSEATTGVESVGGRVATAIAHEQLVGFANCEDQLTVDCAALRGCLWVLSGAGGVPVHVLRIINASVQIALHGDLAADHDHAVRRERLREALDDLAAARDVIEFPNGRWLPAAVRVVPVGNGVGESLLVGGVPSSLLPVELRGTICHHGAFRRTVGDRVQKALNLPTEGLDRWTGAPDLDLLAWTSQVMASRGLDPYEEQSEAQRLRVYAPGSATPGCSQYGRWTDAVGKLPPGRYLARREWLLGGLVPRLVEIAVGRIVRAGVPSLGAGDLRRLCYGLDASAGNPTTAEEEASEGKVTFTLRSEIPHAEARLFAALGQLTIPTDSYYPRRWSFDLAQRDLIAGRLTGLGVRLVPPRRAQQRSSDARARS